MILQSASYHVHGVKKTGRPMLTVAVDSARMFVLIKLVLMVVTLTRLCTQAIIRITRLPSISRQMASDRTTSKKNKPTQFLTLFLPGPEAQARGARKSPGHNSVDHKPRGIGTNVSGVL